MSLLGLVPATDVQADDLNKKSILTFSQPFEIPGKILPAGTYVFEIADTFGDRHIVRIFNKERTEVIATVMTIPDHRLTSTSETVIKFGEVPAGSARSDARVVLSRQHHRRGVRVFEAARRGAGQSLEHRRPGDHR